VKDRPRAFVILIAVFLVGCLAGSAGSYFWLKRSLHSDRRPPDFGDNAIRNGPPARPEPPNFKAILDLTPEQDARFKEITTEYRKQMAEFRKQTDSFHFEQDTKIRAILTEMNRKLSSILSEEQKKKFEAWQKEFENTRRRPPRRRDFPPPPR
jgi:Spy/CpxP family protein refolding chaperone